MGPFGRTDEPLIVGPTGSGGVSSVIDRLVPHLGWKRLDVKPAWRAAARLAAFRGPVVSNTSLRPRAFVRDSALIGLVRGPTAVVWHGWDPGLAQRIDRHPAAFASLGRAGAHGVLTDRQRASLLGWGVDPARVMSVVNPYDPRSVPTRRTPEPMVLFLGRWVAGKGLVELIDAFTEVAADRPALRLVLAGDGPLRGAALTAIGASPARDRVSLTGWIGPDERRRLWARAAALVLYSADEAAPLAVIEALAAGVPVVGTTVGAVPELIGDAGAAVSPRDPRALVRALAAVVDAPPDTGAAAERIRRDHAPERAAAGWRELVSRAVGGFRNNP